MILGLSRNALLANALTKENFGALNYLLSWLPIVSLLGLPGFNTAIAQYVAKGHWEAINLGLRRRLLFAPLPMAALLAFGILGLQRTHSGLVPSLWILTALFFPTAQVLSLISSILDALKRFGHQAVYQVGKSAVFLLATGIGLWAWQGQAVVGVVLFQWALLCLLNALFWARLRRPEVGMIGLSPEQRMQFFRFGKHMTILIAINQARVRIDALLLGTFVSLSSLADFVIGDLFFQQMNMLWTIYRSVSYPRLVSMNVGDRWRQVRREVWLATLCFAVLAGGLGISLTFVIPWLFSDKYGSSLTFAWVLLLAFVCSIPGNFFEMYSLAEEDEQTLYRIRLVAALFGILLPLFLLATYGPLGVPIGRVGANVVYSLVGFALYRQRKP